jgi:SAM-dependent methyltransferase
MSAVRDIESYQRAYAASDFEAVQARLRKRKLLEVLRAWQPQRILEIGCADDALFNHHGDFQRFCVVEPGPAFAALARERGVRIGGGRVRVLQACMEDAIAELADESFDCILLSGLLHEVREPAPLLAAVAAVCTPHTQVHVNVPNARSLHRLLALEMGLIGELHAISDQQRSLQQHSTFDIDSLGAVCEAAGFEVFERGSYFVKPFTHRQMAQLQADGMLDERMLDGLYGLEKHMPGLGSEIFVHLRLRGAE